jgi:hypothetical protein
LDATPSKAQSLQDAEELLNESTVGRLFGSVTIGDDGRTTARDAASTESPESHAAQVENKATQAFVLQAGITARTG